jgi:hypothetical protein
MAQVVTRLPSKLEVLSSNSSITTQKTERKKKKNQSCLSIHGIDEYEDSYYLS